MRMKKIPRRSHKTSPSATARTTARTSSAGTRSKFVPSPPLSEMNSSCQEDKDEKKKTFFEIH